MKKILLLLCVCGPALADDAALLTCRALAKPTERLACYDAVVLAPAQPGRSTAAPTRQAMEQAFGLAPKASTIDAISSAIPGKFDGWGPNQQFKLANGQVWRVVDDSSGVVYGTDLKVTLERGTFGTTFMRIEGTNRSPKVKRIE